jgi:vitamin B12 transporter
VARRPSTCALAALLAVPPALALGEGDDAPAKPSFGEEIVVTGARRRTPAGDPTAAATVVDASRFAGEAKSVAELVATAPGVAVNGYGGLGQLATPSIRGSSADQVQVFLDGLPLNTAAGGGVDLSRVPRGWIDHIEVVRGADGAVYGAGTLGGALNIVTRPVAAGAWSAEATAGSFGTLGTSVAAGAGGARWGALAALAADSTTGRFGYLFDALPAVPGNDLAPRDRDHNAAHSIGGLAKLWAALGDGRLDAVVQLSGGARDLPGSPFQLTPRDGQRDGRLALLARLDEPVGDAVDLTLTAMARDDGLSVRVSPFPEARQRDLAGSLGARVAWRAGPSTFALRASLLGERLAVEGAAPHDRPVLSLGATGELSLARDRLHLVGAVGYDDDGRDRGASLKAGASWRVTRALSLRANGGRSFRPPSFSELYLRQGLLAPNPDLVPERGWSADLAAMVEGALGLASLGTFATLSDDLIVYEAASFGQFKPFNDAKASSRGLEAEVATAPLGPAALSASAAYTYLASETLRGEAAVLGKDLPHRARHRLYARLSAERGPFAAHADAQLVSVQWLDTRNLVPIPSVFTLGAGASARVLRRPELIVALEVKNILGERTLQDGFGNPLPGRMVLLTVRAASDPTGAP